MNQGKLTRREFGLLAGGALIAWPVGQAGVMGARAAAAEKSGTLTAREVVERIKKNIGVPWEPEGSRDTFKAGNPDTPVTGIATTFMATLDVLQRAAAAGRNFVITHEPTFWHDPEPMPEMLDDPIYKYKMDFIARHKMVVWRLHDHIHARKPDLIFQGWTRALGWEKYRQDANSGYYNLPATTVEAVARQMAGRLETRSIRLVGDPQLKITRAGIGSHDIAGCMAVLPQCDLLVVFESRERDAIEYVRDSVLAGQKKAMIVLPHVAGEEAGMNEFGVWLRTIVREAPVEFVPARDGFWMA